VEKTPPRSQWQVVVPGLHVGGDGKSDWTKNKQRTQAEEERGKEKKKQTGRREKKKRKDGGGKQERADNICRHRNTSQKPKGVVTRIFKQKK